MQTTGSHSFFTNRIPRWPVSGRIRGGIQALSAGAKAAIPEAQEIYDEGLKSGASFEEIERAIRKKNPKYTKKPLYPKNTPYFRLHNADFATVGDDVRILALYGEERDPILGPQLYRLPIIFPVDDINVILNQSFATFRGKQRVYWSDPETGACMERIKIEKGSRRRFGAAKGTVRKEQCDPDTCDEFDNEECAHRGVLKFMIPGIIGAGIFEFPFTSVTTGFGVRGVLEMMLQSMGRIHGTFDGKPMFYLSKVRRNIHRIDWKRGEEMDSVQYIAQIEAAGVDMTRLFQNQERQLLGAPKGQEVVVTAPQQAEPEPEPAQDTSDEIVREEITVLVQKLGIGGGRFTQWATGKYGKNALQTPSLLRNMLAELKACEQDGDISRFAQNADGDGEAF